MLLEMVDITRELVISTNYNGKAVKRFEDEFEAYEMLKKTTHLEKNGKLQSLSMFKQQIKKLVNTDKMFANVYWRLE